MQHRFGHFLLILLLAGIARAEPIIPPAMKAAGIDEKLDAQVPLDATFTDETGKSVKLGDLLLPGKPAILQLSYFRCPQLCDMVSQGLSRSMQDLELKMGEDFTVINISFDPKDTPSDAYQKKKSFLAHYTRPGGASWRFLVGTADSVRSVADAIGFKYQYDLGTDQFSHPAALMILSPQGRVMRYLYGVEYPQSTLRLSLVEAAEGKIGNTLDKVMMLCFRYSAVEGRYTLFAMGLMRAAGALTVVVVATVLLRLFIKERRQRQATA